ncbi:hypothetical protein FQA39_LY05940 [Lamprigera yunnana]|nr:hypothetical protein FQA39_LY05940 [Lamprigera yunnana]
MSKMFKKKKVKEEQFKSIGNHQEFLERITKTLYYGKIPSTERLSLPVTELASELFSEPQRGCSLDRLHCNDAAKISRNACVSPCSLVLAVLYLERLKLSNSEYLQRIGPSELFLVSLMVASKFLHDDGEEDEVFIDEWASSGGLTAKELSQLEKEFLAAINWRVHINENTFWKKLGEIEKAIARREGIARGWYTYTELQKLMAVDVTHLLQSISATISVLAVTYALGIITILGSVFIVSNIPGTYINKHVCTKSAESFVFNDISNINNISTIISDDNKNVKYLNALDVFKTSIILASLKTVPNIEINWNKTEFEGNLITNNVTDHSWAWWSNPAMNWLTGISTVIEKFALVPELNYHTYNNYFDSKFSTSKVSNSEDHIHKATKVRIQDQMERSWHKEWTDTFKDVILEYKLLSLCF